MKQLYILLLGAVILCSCRPSAPSVRRDFPLSYDLAYQELYGRCYDSIDYPVVALDLYSDGLSLDENHSIKGSGFNLYLSDIFVPDSLIAEGKYHSLNPSSLQSISPYTFLPGRSFEGTPHGMYILRVEDSKVSSIQVLDSGSFVFRNDSLLFTLYYRGVYGRTIKYTPTFSGTLIPWLKK